MEQPSDHFDTRAVIEAIRLSNEEFYGDPRGRGALKRIEQTFPNTWLYVAELIQNAVDVGATRLRIASEAARFVFEHDGAPFTAENVEAICVSGVSSKSGATVGFMGVGFKSVFRAFERVEIASGPWRFSLEVPTREIRGFTNRYWLGCVLPREDLAIAAPSPGMTCRFVLSGRLVGLEPVPTDVEHVLGAGRCLLPLLARRGVIEVDWDGRAWLLEQVAHATDVPEVTRVAITAVAEDEPTLCWVVFVAEYVPTEGAVRRLLQHRLPDTNSEEAVQEAFERASCPRTVEAFAPLDDDRNLVPVVGEAHALLPTGVPVPLGLHLQADWLLAIDRRNLMDSERNLWHAEIFACVPRLLRALLGWVVGDDGPSALRWEQAYSVLPDLGSAGRLDEAWVHDQAFRDALRAALADLAFLPMRSAEDKVGFVSAEDGRTLPPPLQVRFDTTTARPWDLFGPTTLSLSILGSRAEKCLRALGLLRELSAAELRAHWDAGALARWCDVPAERDKHDGLARVLEGLAELATSGPWASEAFACLPTEDGTFVSRDTAVRLPPNWDAIAADQFQAALRPFVGPSNRIVAWPFDRFLRQNRRAEDFLARVAVAALGDVAAEWWRSRPESPDDETRRLALAFTNWVRTKMAQQENLVRSLLCATAAGEVRLLSSSLALLGPPYAAAGREAFFSDLPLVSTAYLEHDPSASAADWCSFFEKLSPRPSGGLEFRSDLDELTHEALQARAGGAYEVPGLRRGSLGYAVTSWGKSFSQWRYLVRNADFPETLSARLQADDLTRVEALQLAEWLAERPNLLPEEARQRVAYVPYQSSYVFEALLPIKCSWVVALSEARWVPGTDGGGPHRPADALAAPDLTRADAPVAALAPELMQALARAGISLGTAILDAPALHRLRIQGPLVDATRLLELLEATRAEAASSADQTRELAQVLAETALVPVPPGHICPDGARRVSARRCVLATEGRGVSGLAGWVLGFDEFAANGDERRLVEAIAAIVPIAPVPGAVHAIDYLAWVWANEPLAEPVRQVLPRAYRLVREGLADGDARDAWARARAAARVYTDQRRWLAVAGGSPVFFDDGAEPAVREVVGELRLDVATSGHFGETRDQQQATADLLGLPRLSSRFRAEVRASDPEPMPQAWAGRFASLLQYLRRVAQPDEPAPDGERREVVLAQYARLEVCVFVDGEERQRGHRRAALQGDQLAVAGTPDEFGTEAVCALFDAWGVRQGRDLVASVAEATMLLRDIDDGPRFDSRLARLRTALQIVVPPEEVRTAGATGAEAPPGAATPKGTSDRPVEHDDGEGSDGGGDGAATHVPAGTTTSTDARGGASSEPRSGGSGGFDAAAREAKIKALRRQLADLLAAGLAPDAETDEDSTGSGEFGSDDEFREAVLGFEKAAGRFPDAKDATQPGHDVDSYSHPDGHPDRRLVRRIEVKGRGVSWLGDEIVLLSRRQFVDASARAAADAPPIAADFDYWLYVVERVNAELRVIPIKNPALRARKFELRAATWREEAERD